MENQPVWVGLGANLGDPIAAVRCAMDALGELSVAPMARSSLYRSEPVDCPPGSPGFINAVVCLTVNPEVCGPQALLGRLQAMETSVGRQPKQVLNEPRPLDLDLISYGQWQLRSSELILPHPRAAQRLFVMEPLAELAPGMVLPGMSLTVEEICLHLRQSGQRVVVVGGSSEQ